MMAVGCAKLKAVRFCLAPRANEAMTTGKTAAAAVAAAAAAAQRWRLDEGVDGHDG